MIMDHLQLNILQVMNSKECVTQSRADVRCILKTLKAEKPYNNRSVEGEIEDPRSSRYSRHDEGSSKRGVEASKIRASEPGNIHTSCTYIPAYKNILA